MASRRGEETSGGPLPAEVFIARWQGREGGQERANYALFLADHRHRNPVRKAEKG